MDKIVGKVYKLGGEGKKTHNFNRQIDWKKMQKKAKLVIDFFRRSLISFLVTSTVFSCVMAGFCLITTTEIRGFFFQSLIYYLPAMLIITFVSFEFLKSKKIFDTMWAKTIFMLALINIIFMLCIPYINPEIKDVAFAGIIISIQIVAIFSSKYLS